MKKLAALSMVILAAVFWAGSGLAAQDFFGQLGNGNAHIVNLFSFHGRPSWQIIRQTETIVNRK